MQPLMTIALLTTLFACRMPKLVANSRAARGNLFSTVVTLRDAFRPDLIGNGLAQSVADGRQNAA
jgi:hypothetical protein